MKKTKEIRDIYNRLSKKYGIDTLSEYFDVMSITSKDSFGTYVNELEAVIRDNAIINPVIDIDDYVFIDNIVQYMRYVELMLSTKFFSVMIEDRNGELIVNVTLNTIDERKYTSRITVGEDSILTTNIIEIDIDALYILKIDAYFKEFLDMYQIENQLSKLNTSERVNEYVNNWALNPTIVFNSKNMSFREYFATAIAFTELDNIYIMS